jgi:solute carrier family 13 (sodium-dependent dicarboxylate transporter), member 2/3/5
VVPASTVTQSYGHHLVFLFMGGFLIAAAMEKWQLHKRMALHTILLVGTTPRRIVLGFMIATAFLSMWISNTATTMMMLAIAIAVIAQICPTEDNQQASFGTALMLGIAYSASIGGIATLIGTPPNAILAGVIEVNYQISLGFAEWMSFALPLSIVLLAICWYYLVNIAYREKMQDFKGNIDSIQSSLAELGSITKAEKYVAAIFVCVATLWILRGLTDFELFRQVKDSTIAIFGALLLFIIPVDLKKGVFLLDWKSAKNIPWDIMILFGGGFALAKGFSQTGLTEWIANQLIGLQGMNVVMIILCVALLVIFLTEITSNTATASLLLPVMAAFATALSLHPYVLMITTALAASLAFMLPVATPPNAIVFSSRQVSIQQMVRAGFWLNIMSSLLITGFVYFILPLLWDVEL